MEDIGLNINENHNRVEISHYVLLNLPEFSYKEGSHDSQYLNLKTTLKYDDDIHKEDKTQGDFIFAESFQDYCLNMETIIRNNDSYNYASNKTVSERVFWKWIFRHIRNKSELNTDGKYYWEDQDTAIAKGFGLISAGSQRTDDSGLYNETFVQIPSSYGQMRVLFKKVVDENYQANKNYIGTNVNPLEEYIENIGEDEIELPKDVKFFMVSDDFNYPAQNTIITETTTNSKFIVKESHKIDYEIICEWVSDIVTIPENGLLTINDVNQEYSGFDGPDPGDSDDIVIKSTGISPKASADRYELAGNPIYNVTNDSDMFEVELDISKLNQYYSDLGGSDNLTYDNIGTGHTGVNDIDDSYGDYKFNAILVYYSIYDSNKTKRLATNAYGIYLLNTSLEASEEENEDSQLFFYYPSLDKIKSTNKKNGSSYSFRINVRPTTAYSGDIRVNDNSTAAYSMSEDFNDVLRNLTAAVTTMKENAKTLYDIAKDSRDVKRLAEDTMEKVNDIETNVDNIKNGNFPYTASNIFTQEGSGRVISSDTAKEVLSCFTIGFDTTNNEVKMSIDPTKATSSFAKTIATSIRKNINENKYVDIISIIGLLISRFNATSSRTSTILTAYGERITDSYSSINMDNINPRYRYTE